METPSLGQAVAQVLRAELAARVYAIGYRHGMTDGAPGGEVTPTPRTRWLASVGG